jgi:DNA (cytosine-5)-methyltransferase 1
MTEGFRRAGFRTLAAIEADPIAATTHGLNHPEAQVLLANVEDVRSGDIYSALGARARIDLVIGGPPCVGFSAKGRRDPRHPANKLFLHFARLVGELQPRVFVMENVPGLRELMDGYFLDWVVRSFENLRVRGGLRYWVQHDVFDAADFGVPQSRRRLLFVGMLPGVDLSIERRPGKSRRITVGEAVGDLPPDPAPRHSVVSYPAGMILNEYQRDRRRASLGVYNHSCKRLETLRLSRIASLSEGDDKRAIPKRLQAGGHDSKYRRLDSGKPSPTLVAHMAHDCSDFIHPWYDRPLTVREAARLQSFDDTYRFCGSEYQQLKQVGNAVPPLLVTALAKQIRQHLER